MMEPWLSLLPERASTYAANVDWLYLFLNLLTAFFTLLVAGLVVYFAVKYRRRADNQVGKQIVGSTRLEIGWMVALLPLALIAFAWGAWLYVDVSTPPEDAAEVFVIGKQWMWKFVHESGQQEINELHVPIGVPIKLTMISQDVIHSFYVPAFRVKADVLPGRYSTTWFEASKPGTYHLFCAEYCGTLHSGMIGQVVALEPGEYQDWLSGEAGGGKSPVEAGEALFERFGCARCHRPDGTGRGPSLVGVFGQPVQLAGGKTVTADESYIRESILDPTAKVVAGYEPIMPTFEGQISENQLIQLIAYIKSLGAEKAQWGSGDDLREDPSS